MNIFLDFAKYIHNIASMSLLEGNVNHENGIFRPEANFSPSMWGNIFRDSSKDNQVNIRVYSQIFL